MDRRATALTIFLLAGAASAAAQTPVGDVSASDANILGTVTMTLSGPRVMSGSKVTAGQSAASIRLLRGGEVRICPRSTVSVSTSPTGSDFMFALGTGAVEAHYTLPATRDVIITPDFRITLTGPGDFHVAIGADSRGNTCIRSLERSTASVVIEEQMGDGVYQLGPRNQVLFRNGSVRHPVFLVPPDCGCPAPAAPLLTEARPIPRLETVLPVAQPDPDLHVQVDAPFVFRAEEPATPPPAEVAHLSMRRIPPPQLDIQVSPTSAESQVQQKQRSGSVFGRVRSLFRRIFR